MDAATVASQKTIMQAYGVTNEQLRALSGFAVAFDAFFAQLDRTPGVSDILWQIAERPSMLSMIRGLRADVTNYEPYLLVDPASWGFPPGAEPRVNSLLVKLNEQPAIRVDLLVLPPKGVLRASAGVVGLLARPGKSSGAKILVIRLIGAKRSDATAAP